LFYFPMDILEFGFLQRWTLSYEPDTQCGRNLL
jgi:hypothetical protein